jgi:hypothetical protein
MGANGVLPYWVWKSGKRTWTSESESEHTRRGSRGASRGCARDVCLHEDASSATFHTPRILARAGAPFVSEAAAFTGSSS